MSAAKRVFTRPAPVPELTAARARLRDAIARAQEAQKAVDALEAATAWSGAATVAVRAADDRLESLRKAIKQAEAGAADALLAEALGAPPKTARTAAQARQAAAEAENDLTAAKATLATLVGRIGAAKSTLELARMGVKSAVGAVVADEGVPKMAALLAEFDALCRRFVDIGFTISVLLEAGVPERGAASPPGLHEAKYRLDMSPKNWAIARSMPAAAAKFKTALDALATNAMAPLPDA